MLLKHRTIFKGAFDYAYQRQLIFENPMVRQIDHKVRFFTNEQLRDILAAVRGLPIESAVFIALFTGFRRGEVLGLRWRSVDFENDTITTKHTIVRCGSEIIRQDLGKDPFSVRVISMPLPLKIYLMELQIHQKQDQLKFGNAYYSNDYVCKQKKGKPLAPDYVTSQFKKFLIENDLPPYNFHTLRHSSATFLLSQGFQPKEIQGWLGYKKLESANRYAHLQFNAIVNMAHAFDELIKNNPVA